MRTSDGVALHTRAAGAIIGYLGRHWRGEFSLPYSYWVNFILPLFPLKDLLRFAYYVRGYGLAPSETGGHFLFGAAVLAALLFALWSLTGLWRSAGRSIRDGGGASAYAARAAVCLVACTLVLGGAFAGAAMTIPGFGLGRQVVYAVVHGYAILARRNVVSFSGRLNERAAAEIAGALATRERAVLALSDARGSAGAARGLAAYVREHEVTVLVSGRCDSGCALVLAASPSRIVRRAADVSIRIPGEDAHSQELREEFASYYAADGASEGLLTALFDSADSRFARPSLRLLAAEGVVTHVMDARRAVLPVAQWCEAHAELCDLR